MSPELKAEEVRRSVGGLPIRVEADGPEIRFVWTGGQEGLTTLGFEPPLPLYASRDDVPVWLLRRPGKSQVPKEYRDAVSTYWRRPEPSTKKLEQAVEACAEDARQIAHEVVGDYNELLVLSAAVTAVLKEEGLTYDRLPSMWKRATNYLRDGGPPPNSKRHPFPSDAVWGRTFAGETARLDDHHRPFVEAVNARAEAVLTSRFDKMAQAAVLRAREVVLGAFQRVIVDGGERAVRPTCRSFWTWPYTEDNADQAFLGVMAMRLFENTSADDDRHVKRQHGDAEDFHFIHAPAETRTAKGGGLVVLKEEFSDPNLTADDLLRTMTKVWPLYGGGTIKEVQLDTVRKRFRSARVSNVKARLKRLMAIESAYGLVGASPGRYEPPDIPKDRTKALVDRIKLSALVPLAASVAVVHELALAAREGRERPFG